MASNKQALHRWGRKAKPYVCTSVDKQSGRNVISNNTRHNDR